MPCGIGIGRVPPVISYIGVSPIIILKNESESISTLIESDAPIYLCGLSRKIIKIKAFVSPPLEVFSS